MSLQFARLLRLRALIEESSRMELERRAALAARVEDAQWRERESARELRQSAIASVRGSDSVNEQSERRTVAWESAELAMERERQLEPLAEAVARRVMEGREEFFERRKERRQMEGLVDADRARMRAELERRTQRELDDWFGMRLIRRRG